MDRPARLISSLAALLVAVGCDQAPAEAPPPVQGAWSTSYLDDELGRVNEEIAEARGTIRSDPDRTTELLITAEEHVRGLRDLYLPLLEARETAIRAYRLHTTGSDSDAIEELDDVRERVLQVSREARGPLVGELQRIEALVAEAQIALEADSAQATSTLYRLLVEMEDFMTKAGMFMGSDH